MFDPNRFFGHHIDPFQLGGKAFALMLAVILGGLVGFDRECRGQSAGLRTHILVCVGSAMITLTSVEIGLDGKGGVHGDPARLAAQIVSGIGFLGAGAILREGLTIHGLTTAASVWTVAAIGIAVGSSPHLGELAVIGTVIVLATLVVLNYVEDKLNLKQRVRLLEVEVVDSDKGPTRVLNLLKDMGIVVYGVTTQSSAYSAPEGKQATRRMQIQVKLPGRFDRDAFIIQLNELPGVVSFHID